MGKLGIIFDCDGTLVDTEELHLLSWQKALQTYGLSMTREEYCSDYAGYPAIFILKKLQEKGNSKLPPELLHHKKQWFKQVQKDRIFPIHRTIKFLKELAVKKEELNIKLAVASAAHKNEILSHLDRIQVREMFDVIVSGEDDLSDYFDPEGVNKPKPYIYLHAAKLLGIDPKDCIAFEDSHVGVMSATKAGITTFAVPNTFTLGHDLSPANFFIDPTIDIELHDLFQKIGYDPF